MRSNGLRPHLAAALFGATQITRFVDAHVAAAGKRLHKPAAMPAPAAAAIPLQATTTRTTNSAAEYSPRAKAGSWKEWLAQRQIRMSSTAQTLPSEVAAPSVQRV